MTRGPRNGSVYRRVVAQVAAEGTHCGICGQPLNPDLRYPHPLSTVTDHIRTLAQGGDLLDRNNLQPAHKRCNERKGGGQRPGKTPKPGEPRHSRDW